MCGYRSQFVRSTECRVNMPSTGKSHQTGRRYRVKADAQQTPNPRVPPLIPVGAPVDDVIAVQEVQSARDRQRHVPALCVPTPLVGTGLSVPPQRLAQVAALTLQAYAACQTLF